MNPKIFFRTTVLAGFLAWAVAPNASRAGTFFSDFNSGSAPAGTMVTGLAVVSTDGGYTNSGCVKLMDEFTAGTGDFIITEDLNGGKPAVSFTAGFKALVGSHGNGADGFSFVFDPNLDQSGTWGEEGTGTGMTVEFDTYPNGAPDTAPSIDVMIGGTEITNVWFPGIRAGDWVDVVIQLNPDKTLTVIYDGVYAYSNYALPSSYTPALGSQFGLGARCGGTTDNHFIDNLSIVTHTNLTPFVQAMGPQGRRVQANSPIHIVLADSGTQVNPSSVALQLDGHTVVPTVNKVGARTTIDFTPPAVFMPLSKHTVSVAFRDNASTPEQFSLQYEFGVQPVWKTLFSDDFEHRNLGALDMDYAGPNASANGDLAGNPWFGPLPPNLRVITNENGIFPHSGTNMIRGAYSPQDFDQDWINLAYRFNGSNAYTGNIRLDWWFYDPIGAAGDNGTNFQDYAAIGYYNTAPTDTDYPGSGSLNAGPPTQVQRLCLGAASNLSASGNNGQYDPNKYQVRVVNADDGYSAQLAGWFNLPTDRSIGWHHGRIVVGPALANSANLVDFYLDDMVNPVFSHNAILNYGYNVIELNAMFKSVSAYYDDVSFAVVQPVLSTTRSGSSLTLTWDGTFVLQSAPDVTGPWTDLPSAASPYTYDMTSGPKQFFRVHN